MTKLENGSPTEPRLAFSQSTKTICTFKLLLTKKTWYFKSGWSITIKYPEIVRTLF